MAINKIIIGAVVIIIIVGAGLFIFPWKQPKEEKHEPVFDSTPAKVPNSMPEKIQPSMPAKIPDSITKKIPDSIEIKPSDSMPAKIQAKTPSPVLAPAAPIVEPRAAEERVVEMTAQGFSPSSITISSGTTVRFVNKDSVSHWPASGVHPVHQVCPGFDALQPVQPGDSYFFTFTVAKTCPVHDHLNPEIKGSIIVQ